MTINKDDTLEKNFSKPKNADLLISQHILECINNLYFCDDTHRDLYIKTFSNKGQCFFYHKTQFLILAKWLW